MNEWVYIVMGSDSLRNFHDIQGYPGYVCSTKEIAEKYKALCESQEDNDGWNFWIVERPVMTFVRG